MHSLEKKSIQHVFQIVKNSQQFSCKRKKTTSPDNQFNLGSLITEKSHPKTHNLSKIAKNNLEDALGVLSAIDSAIFPVFKKAIYDGTIERITQSMVQALYDKKRIFFCGCGATGRLSIYLESLWRGFFQKYRLSNSEKYKRLEKLFGNNIEERIVSVIAGGDFALIKSVEHFEDYSEFGKQQLRDLRVSEGDVVISITEGGETSFVIGTALRAVQKNACVFFVYNNPDTVLVCLERSNRILTDERIVKINLTTGAQAIAGSTRMQATSIQSLVLGAALEYALYKILKNYLTVHELEVIGFEKGAFTLYSLYEKAKKTPKAILKNAKNIVSYINAETHIYREGGNFYTENDHCIDKGYVTYISDENAALNVLTDTTERSPTFFTPPFRRKDDTVNKASPSYMLITGAEDNADAWETLLKRRIRSVQWTDADYKRLSNDDTFSVPRITKEDILEFAIGGKESFKTRPFCAGNLAVGVSLGEKVNRFLRDDSDWDRVVKQCHAQGAKTGVILVSQELVDNKDISHYDYKITLSGIPSDPLYLLQGITLKMTLNTISTLTMVLLNRVSGNKMVYVAPTNKKLIDRSIRIISQLTGFSYEEVEPYFFAVLDTYKNTDVYNKSPFSPAMMCILSIQFKIDCKSSHAILQETEGDLDLALWLCEQVFEIKTGGGLFAKK
ncbi:hypothetical protein ACFL1T_03510 [Chlamydiota bacterium]